MSRSPVPGHVRAHIFLFRFGAAAGALGVIGFFLSYWQVASPALAAGDVHYEIPMLAYASIFAWFGGIALMWYSRRQLRAAVERKQAEDREAIYVDDLRPEGVSAGRPSDDTAVHAPDGRDT